MGIVVTRDGAVALVEVDRQAALNALDIASVTELEARVRELSEDPAIRCLVLTGAGERAFIGGADLAYMSRVTPEQAREFATIGHEVGRLLETMPKPTIAAVNGYALGGGCEMALACDIRYASPNAKLGQPEVTFGLIPGWGGSQRLARTTTLGFAKELIFTGRYVGAEEALRRGLVDDVADPVRDKALETAHLIARNSPSALRAAKELCNRALQGSHAGSLAAERERIAEVLVSDDAREGTSAFLEKRQPAFHRFHGRKNSSQCKQAKRQPQRTPAKRQRCLQASGAAHGCHRRNAARPPERAWLPPAKPEATPFQTPEANVRHPVEGPGLPWPHTASSPSSPSNARRQEPSSVPSAVQRESRQSPTPPPRPGTARQLVPRATPSARKIPISSRREITETEIVL